VTAEERPELAESAVSGAERASIPAEALQDPTAENGAESEAVEETVEEAVFEAIAETADSVNAEDFMAPAEAADESDRAHMKALLEAVIYITDEPLSPQQIAAAVERPLDQVQPILDELVAEYARPEHGLSIREVAGGFKMATKPEHHEAIRAFVKNLKPPLKLSLAALETLAVVAYKQPITAPEIMDIRGVQGAGVLKTLLDRKLIATAGRKNVVGKPILYKTTRDFLVQFGLKDLAELPTLKEFEELGRLALTDEPAVEPAAVETQEIAGETAGDAEPPAEDEHPHEDA
jgi:segregation and condensation protein B